MRTTRCNGWNDGADKDTFWNLAVLACCVLIGIASAIDLPQAPGEVVHAEHSYVIASARGRLGIFDPSASPIGSVDRA